MIFICIAWQCFLTVLLLFYFNLVRWEYKTDKHDIGFSVFKKENEELKEIVTNERTDCFNLTIDGIITVNEPGTCE